MQKLLSVLPIAACSLLRRQMRTFMKVVAHLLVARHQPPRGSVLLPRGLSLAQLYSVWCDSKWGCLEFLWRSYWQCIYFPRAESALAALPSADSSIHQFSVQAVSLQQTLRFRLSISSWYIYRLCFQSGCFWFHCRNFTFSHVEASFPLIFLKSFFVKMDVEFCQKSFCASTEMITVGLFCLVDAGVSYCCGYKYLLRVSKRCVLKCIVVIWF